MPQQVQPAQPSAPAFGGLPKPGMNINPAAASRPQFNPNGPTAGTAAIQAPVNRPAAPRAYNVAPSAVSSRAANGDAVLNGTGSKSVLHQLNANRASMGALNRRAIPSGAVTSHANGFVTVQAAGGRQYDLRPDGRLASFSSQGRKAEFRSNGQLGVLHTTNMDMVRGVHGERTITVRGPDNSLIVSTGLHSGYVQKQILIQGQPYQQRTVVQNGVVQTRIYSVAVYHGVEMPHYVPAYRFAPAFYGWAFYPWAAPVRYAWDWQSAPWYGQYATYYTPAPAYPAPSMWLTDYYLSQTMANGYQVQMDAAQAPANADLDPSALDHDTYSSDAYAQVITPITPQLKMELSEQVRQQVAAENVASRNPQDATNADSLDRVLVPNHLFVVDQSLSVATAGQQQCGLSAGNVLRLTAVPAADSLSANMVVASSRQSECPAGQQVTVSLVDLQEMQNNLRIQLDAGLLALRAGQGQGGLPKAPKSAIEAPPRPIEELPEGDADALAQLDSAQQQADSEEAQVTAAAFQGNGS